MQAVFDHLTLNARDDLESACKLLESLGFHLTAPSYQSIGAVNRCAVLEGAYLELIAIDPAAQTPRAELLSQPPGLNALVFRTDDAQACFESLNRMGLPALPVQSFTRMVRTSAGGEAQAGFRVVRLEADWARRTLAFGRVYFCQHLTPELIFDAGFIKHGNGKRSLTTIDVEVRDLQMVHASLGLMFGEAFALTADGARLDCGLLQIHFHPGARDRILACGFNDPKQVHDHAIGRFLI